jgi:hypothetical protein
MNSKQLDMNHIKMELKIKLRKFNVTKMSPLNIGEKSKIKIYI